MSSYRSWGSTDDGRIKFQSLTDETVEGGLDVIRKSYFRHESASLGVDLISEPGAGEELEELCLNTAKDGVTLVAIDINSNEVVGVCFNKIQVDSLEKSYFKRFSENCRYKSSKCLVDFTVNMNSRMNLFKHYNVNCILEILFLAIRPDYWRRNIGEQLIASLLEFARELKRGKDAKTPVTVHGSNELTNADAIPGLICAVATSHYSQQIAMKFRFDQLLEASYDEFEFDGKKFSERIKARGKEHRRCLLVAKTLPQ